jgi:uncharacterized protein YaiE (UPF0345 family)
MNEYNPVFVFWNVGVMATRAAAATFATAAPMRMTPVMDHLTIVGKMAPELAARKEPVYVYRRW